MKTLRNQSGVAMMMALVTMFLLAIVAGEITYQSGIFSSVVFRQRDQLQATLLARSGLRLALLQLRAAKKAKAKAKSMGLGDNSAMVDKIWQTPMILPPPDIPGLAPSDNATLGEFRKSLGLEGTVSVNIQGENGRISINQLVWPQADDKTNGNTPTCKDAVTGQPHPCSAQELAAGGAGAPPGNPNQSAEEKKKAAQKKVHDSFVEMFNNILEKKRQDDDSFREKYAGVTGEQLVGNLQAWMDPNTTMDGNSREKMDYYSRVEPSPYMPKNAPIASDSEYHMIEGLDEVLSKLVNDNFTIQATSSLDVNKAPMSLIHAIIPELNQDVLDHIDKRRKDDALGGPFKGAEDFWAYLTQNFGNFDEAKNKVKEKGIKILEADSTYRAVITAHVDGTNTHKTWLADIGPLPPKDSSSTSTATTTQPQPVSQNTSTSTSTNTSTGTSDDDYDNLSIVYLKAE